MSAPPPSLIEKLPGPWEERPSGLPPGGPRSWWWGPAGVVIGGPPPRVAAELEGWARLGPHPARPALRELAHDGVLLPPLGAPVEDPVSVVAAWPRGRPWTGRLTASAALRALDGRTDPARALAKLGVKRRHIDRFLHQPLDLATHVGPGLGGLAGGWLRQSEAGPVALRWSGAGAAVWRSLDLAGVCLSEDEDGAELHALDLSRPEADRAWHLALLRRALDEAVLGEDEAAAARALDAFARLAPGAEPDEVQVSMDNLPDFIHADSWIPAHGRVSAARARWLLHNLDGLWVGGQRLAVRVDPPLRAGRAPPPRAPRSERRRALFSRWDQGVAVDEEGLWSATPEALAERIAAGLRGRVMDGTAGLGCIAIALARAPQISQVTAVDLSAPRLALARKNAALYGVADRIRWVAGDVAAALRAGAWDALVLDPPWGGPGYDRDRVLTGSLGLDMAEVIAAAPARVRVKLPRSIDVADWRAALPGTWSFWPLIDDRGVIKALIADRGAPPR